MYFFFNDTATTEIYTLSLHDALPIFSGPTGVGKTELSKQLAEQLGIEFLRYDMSEYAEPHTVSDRKSTRLNSSHANISYAVFCLKKKKTLSLCLSFISFPHTPPHLPF